jgi:hypothetical protein
MLDRFGIERDRAGQGRAPSDASKSMLDRFGIESVRSPTPPWPAGWVEVDARSLWDREKGRPSRPTVYWRSRSRCSIALGSRVEKLRDVYVHIESSKSMLDRFGIERASSSLRSSKALSSRSRCSIALGSRVKSGQPAAHPTAVEVDARSLWDRESVRDDGREPQRPRRGRRSIALGSRGHEFRVAPHSPSDRSRCSIALGSRGERCTPSQSMLDRFGIERSGLRAQASSDLRSKLMLDCFGIERRALACWTRSEKGGKRGPEPQKSRRS